MTRSDGDERTQPREMAAMFDRVASRYDFLNRVLSLGRDIGWRERAVALACLGANEVALDIGVGTGDLAFDLLAASPRSSHVVGIDVSERMLELARARAAARGFAPRFEARAADAHALPFSDASFDRVLAGFAVRNFGDLDAGLREMRRVLRSGGRAVILEFSHPPNSLVRPLHGLYLRQVTPRVAALLGGDVAAYRYLPRSIDAFPGAEALADRMRGAGFTKVRFERLMFGATAIHIAEP